MISPAPDVGKALDLKPDRLAVFVQVGAFSNKSAAEMLKKQVKKEYSDSAEIFVAQAPGRVPALFRVRIGPLLDKLSAGKIVDGLNRAEIGQPIIITRAVAAKGR